MPHAKKATSTEVQHEGYRRTERVSPSWAMCALELTYLETPIENPSAITVEMPTTSTPFSSSSCARATPRPRHRARRCRPRSAPMRGLDMFFAYVFHCIKKSTRFATLLCKASAPMLVRVYS